MDIDAVRWDELRKQVENMVDAYNQVDDFTSSEAYDKVIYFMDITERNQKVADIEKEIEAEKLKLRMYWPTDLINDLLVLNGLTTSRKGILIRIKALETQIANVKTGKWET